MIHEEKTLVVGATGLLGTEIVRLLLRAHKAVRAVVRASADPGKMAKLEASGVETIVADLKVPTSIVEACRGVTTVISTATAIQSRQAGDSIRKVDEEGQLALVEAAENADVRHFVFVSFPPNDMSYAFQDAKRAVERRLRESRMHFTILQSVNFMEVWLSPALGFDPLGGSVRLFGDANQPVSWIAVHDVARFAVGAPDYNASHRRILPLGGPDALSPREVVRIFEELGAPKISSTHVPESAIEAQMSGAKDEVTQAFAAAMLATVRGQTLDPHDALKLVPGPLVTVRDYARRILRAAEGRNDDMHP